MPIYTHANECVMFWPMCQRQREEWISRWPHHCHVCRGFGGWPNDDDCPACAGNNFCGRCFQPLHHGWLIAGLFAILNGIHWSQFRRRRAEGLGILRALLCSQLDKEPAVKAPCIHCDWCWDDGCPEELPLELECDCTRTDSFHHTSYNAVC